ACPITSTWRRWCRWDGRGIASGRHGVALSVRPLSSTNGGRRCPRRTDADKSWHRLQALDLDRIGVSVAERIADSERELALALAGGHVEVQRLRAAPARRQRQGECPQLPQQRLAEGCRRTLILLARLLHLDGRDGVGGTGDAGVVASETQPDVELAAARVRIEVTGGIVVGADLLVRRRAVALEGRGLHVDRRLEQAVGLLGPPARDAQRRDHLGAAGRALAAGRPVGRAVVALLAAFGDAVAAALEPARRRAAVARHLVAVVALLAHLDLAVAADGGVR